MTLTREQYEAKREARYMRLLTAADRAESEGKRQREESNRMASVIPLGQPILVGHYSEGRDRRYRERIHAKMRRGYELMQRADELRARAQAAQDNQAIFSDDPDAVEKLTEKIERLEKRQELMKAANRLIRKEDRNGLRALGFSDANIQRLLTPDFCGRIGFADFELKNNNANIRRLKQRAEQVERRQAMEDKTEEIEGIRIEYSPSENRIRVRYPGRVDSDTFRQLRAHGFRVLRSEGDGAFSAYYNANALYFIRTYIKKG